MHFFAILDVLKIAIVLALAFGEFTITELDVG